MPELLYLQMYRKMLLIRLFEEQARDLFMKNMISRRHAHVYRRGGDCRRGMFSAYSKRYHHQHPSRSWTLPGKRRRSRFDDG